MRYAWDQFDAYFGRERLGPVAHAAMRAVMGWLARWDAATANRVHHFVANSRFVAGRIARYYNRQASVLYPPVDVDFFTPAPQTSAPYFLVVSALVPYKRIDVAIGAAARAGVPLKIVGTGPDRDRLARMAGPGIELLGAVGAEALRDLYRGARALVLPAEEDFGIAPVEAMACGCPVIALGRGGATETVEPGVTGLLVDEASPEAFAEAMRQVSKTPFDRDALVARAAGFSTDRFEAAFLALAERVVAEAPAC
jgi:glycosyltransferase involved in cell wall biosynthesis